MTSSFAAALRHFRHAARVLRRTPTLTLASIVTLAIGLGPTTAIFSVVYGVLLRPLPYPDAARLVQLNYLRQPQGQTAGFSIPELADWTKGSATLQHLAMYGSSSFNLAGEVDTEVIRAAMVSENFFALLQPRIPLGRVLAADDAAVPDLVLGARLWQRRFNGDPHIVGRTVTLNGTAYTVVGVAPSTFRFPADDVDAWIPLGFAKSALAAQWQMRGFRAFSVIGRIAPRMTVAQAAGEVQATARALAQAYPQFNADLSASVTPLRERLTSAVRPAVLVLFGAVGCVWLIACANLANLALARSAPRAREAAVRTALGARRGHLAAQYLAEGALLSTVGGAIGVGIADLCLQALTRLPSVSLPRLEEIRLDTPVVVFALVLSAIATLVFGALPAARCARPIDALREARSVTNRAARRMHQGLIVVEVAIAVVLLVGASLFMRSLTTLLAADTGARTAGVLTLKMNMAPSVQQGALIDRIGAAVGRLPGVTAVGVTSNLPPNLNQMRTSFTLSNAAGVVAQEFAVEIVSMSGDVFGALGVPLLAGRTFSDADTAASRRVLILSDRAAKAFFPGRDAIGQSLPFGQSDPKALPPVVVGVVGDVKYGGLDVAPDGALYQPYAQQPFRTVYFAIRTPGDPLAISNSVRRAILAEDPSVAVSDLNTLEAVVSASAAEPRLRTTLIAAMAGVALLLAGVGLYGVIAYGVTQRTAEIGLRVALGARPRDVLELVMRQGLGLTLTGVTLGAVTARLLTGVVARFLYGVGATDVWSFAIAMAFVLAIGAIATFVPARRATRVDPMVAWRTID